MRGFRPQINIVRDEGRRAVLLTILKNGKLIDFRYHKKLKEILPIPSRLGSGRDRTHLAGRPIDLCQPSNLKPFKEGLLATLLTGILILFFLRSWINTESSSFDSSLNFGHASFFGFDRLFFEFDDVRRTCISHRDLGR